VLGRLEAGRAMSAADYSGLLAHRTRIRAAVAAQTRGFDVLVLPTVAIAPPALADLSDVAASRAINALIVRNTAIANFLDRPAISIPCHAAGDAPVGFMAMGETGLDRCLLSAAQAMEETVRGRS
jgi:aspartyl-tRNA(Asn)/glutamyl-tRNA(Gln) amidotransferase subunit A